MSSKMSCPNNPDFAVVDVPGYQKYDKQAVPSSAATTVPDKFKGTKNDQNDMVLLGKKTGTPSQLQVHEHLRFRIDR
jgi:hypothetical protein